MTDVEPSDVATPRRLGVAHYFDGHRLVAGDVEVRGRTVTAVGLPPARTGIAAPGWLDVQVNGFAGVDFNAKRLEHGGTVR